ncbi:insulinase family protein [Parvicella tangerina]|nr:insulinase family protein [Parvicella tangerina]
MRTFKNIYTVATLSLVSLAAIGQEIDRSTAPEPGPAPKINIGSPETFTLENGLKVFVVENHKLPKVSIQLAIDKPLIMEGEKVGVGEMTGEMLNAGTTEKTKAEMDEEIDFIGASVTATSSGVFASSLSKHADKVMGIMSEMLLKPAFPQEELDKAKKRALSNLKSLSTNPEAIAGRVQDVLLYGKNHPYGEVQTAEHVNNITIADCKKYYQDYFRPNISYLVIVGDITPEVAKEKATQYFGSWEKREVPGQKYEADASVAGVRVAFVEKPGAVQSVIKVTYPLDLKVGSEDDAAIKIMNGIFGGAFSSRLNMNLREEHGYTYGAGGRASADRYIGYFSAGASVRNEVTDSAVNEILGEMKEMIETKVTEDELSRNINYNNGNFALSLESDQTVARFALNIEKYDLPADYYQNYLSRLQAVTMEDVQAAAKNYIHPENCIILVVGSRDVVDNLKQFDTDGKIEFYDYNGNVKSGEKKKLPEGLTADQVIEDYVLAYTQSSSMKKAEKKLKKVKDITMVSETEMQGMKLEITIKRKAPNMMLSEMNMSGMTVQKSVFNGSEGGSSGMQGNQAYEGDELEEQKYSSTMHLETKYDELGYKLNLKSIEEVNGKDAYMIEVTDPMGNVENEYYDVESKLKVYSMSTTESPETGEMTVTSEFQDYQEVDGILYPHKMIQNFGEQVLEMDVKEIKVNSKISKSEFEFEP